MNNKLSQPKPQSGHVRNRTFVAVVGVLVLLHVLFWPGTGNKGIEFDVTEGATAQQLARQLGDAGFLRSPYLFLAWLHVRLAGSRIQTGHYKFSTGRSAFWIVDDLI